MYPPIKTFSQRFPLWPQWLAATEVFLLGTTLGLCLGWVTPYLAKLSQPESELRISKEDASWIVSLMWICKLVGSILESNYVYHLGTKSSTLISGIFFALGWSCFLITNSLTSIYVFRILSGIGTGMLFNAFPLYIGEISHPKIRGALVSFILQGNVVGNLMGTTMGAYLDTWTFAAISLVPNSIFIISFILLPHSPHHLVRHGKMDEAKKSIQWYNRNADVASELAALVTFMHTNQSSTYCHKLRDFNTPINRKTLMMGNIIFGLVAISGSSAVVAYMEIILTQTRVTVIAPSSIVIILSVLSLVTSWIAIYTNDKFGRTIMLSISSLAIALSMILWGLNYYFIEIGFDSPYLQWMSIIAAILFFSALPIGMITVPSILLSELFAPNIKSVASCITNMISSLLTFAVCRSYQPMVDILSDKWVFLMYALPLVLLGAYTIIFIPETKGKSLAEIQELLARKKKYKSNAI